MAYIQGLRIGTDKFALSHSVLVFRCLESPSCKVDLHEALLHRLSLGFPGSCESAPWPEGEGGADVRSVRPK